MALGVLLGILGADDAAFDQPADVGVIASQAPDAGTTNQIEAAVSDVGKIKLATAHDECGAGGAHAMKGGMLLGKFLNAGVSGGKGFD